MTIKGAGAFVFCPGCAADGAVELTLPCAMAAVLVAGAAAAARVFAAACATVFCDAEAAPFPDVPVPGKTVPCCRPPTLGCAAEGVAMGAFDAVLAGIVLAGGFAGKLIGGSFSGTGIGAAAEMVSAGGAGGLRRNTPINGAEAAGIGPRLRAAAEPPTGCTRKITWFPSWVSSYGRAPSRSTTTRVTGGFALFKPTRTPCTPFWFSG